MGSSLATSSIGTDPISRPRGFRNHLAAEGLREELMSEADAEGRNAVRHELANERFGLHDPRFAFGDVRARAGDHDERAIGWCFGERAACVECLETAAMNLASGVGDHLRKGAARLEHCGHGIAGRQHEHCSRAPRSRPARWWKHLANVPWSSRLAFAP